MANISGNVTLTHETRLEARGVVHLLGLARNVEEVDAHEDDKEAHEERDGVDGVGRVETLEKNGRRGNGGRREENIVDGVDNVGGESVEGLVEIVHLDQDAPNDNNTKEVGAEIRELVLASKRELDGNTKALDGHDRDGAHERADREVDHGVGGAVPGHYAEDHKGAEDGNEGNVDEEGWQKSVRRPWNPVPCYSRILAARSRISSTLSTSLSDGACRTIMTEPIIQLAQPHTPSLPSFSSKKKDARMALGKGQRISEKVQRQPEALLVQPANSMVNGSCDGPQYGPYGKEGMAAARAMPQRQAEHPHAVQNSPDDNTHGTEGSDEDRGRERVRGKVGHCQFSMASLVASTGKAHLHLSPL